MGQEYKYTQVGIVTILMILLVGAVIAFLFNAGLKSTEGQDAAVLKVTVVVTGVFILALALFYSFTIQIADGKLNFWFGFGVIRKSFPIEGIRSCEIVRTPWYYGWGIKSIPGGWLYSIAPGGRALELIFKDDRKIHLGTDRPGEIKQRIDMTIERSA
jgi:hypothetical protein